VISVEDHGEIIVQIVEELMSVTESAGHANTLRNQFKLYKGDFKGSTYAELGEQSEYQVQSQP